MSTNNAACAYCGATPGNYHKSFCALPGRVEGASGIPAFERPYEALAHVGEAVRADLVEALASGMTRFELALDTAYPTPDSPHTSVLIRAADDRTAFKRGWNSALAASAQEGISRDLSDTEIVSVLASLGIDSDKSIHTDNPVLQVRTTVPGIRRIVAAYLKAAAQGNESGAGSRQVPETWRDKLRWSKANTDYHGYIAFTPAQLEHFVSMLAAAAPAVPVPAEQDQARDAELYRALNTPEVADFIKGVEREALHQRDRWGSSHDAGKAHEDWFWLLGYLGGKALSAAKAGNDEKALHHTISSAASLLNWHAAILGAHTAMRPGIEPPSEGAA